MCELSIGIPTYNQATFLEETILSLLNQKVPPFEIVVSNNHSIDGTESILKQFNEEVRIIYPPVHLGMMAHWNFVVSNLRSEWFSLLSSDDVALPNYVEGLCRGISRSENAVLVRSGYETINETGSIIERRYILSARRITKPPRTLLEQLEGPKINFAAFAARKDAWKKVGGFPEECALIGDWGFWIKISSLGNFVYERDIISRYRTAYRAGLEKARFLEELEDEVILHLKIIPEAAEKITGIQKRKLKTAMKRRLQKRIARASQLGLSLEERERVVKIIYLWTEMVDCTDLLSLFKKGNAINYNNSMKEIIRPTARKIYCFLDRALRRSS